jgi:hypothetical protein
MSISGKNSASDKSIEQSVSGTVLGIREIEPGDPRLHRSRTLAEGPLCVIDYVEMDVGLFGDLTHDVAIKKAVNVASPHVSVNRIERIHWCEVHCGVAAAEDDALVLAEAVEEA